MQEIVKKEWSELRPIWNQLVQNNPIATPFQSYEFLTITGKGKLSHKDIFRTFGLKELNVVLYTDQVPVAIAPLLYKTKNGKSTVYFRGHFTATNQLDFIYGNLSYDDFKFLMDGIRNMLGEVAFCLEKIYYASPTVGYLKQYLSSAKVYETECFALRIPKQYDDWVQSLHKSRREKLKQSRNRMATDNVEWSASFYFGEKIDAATNKEMMLVYADRFLIKNNFHFGSLQPLARKALQFFLLRDKMTRFLNQAGDGFHIVVHMNGEIAAFASGLLCKGKRMIGNRLAINTKFGRYSPGVVLFQSTIRYLSQQNEAGTLDVKILDMGQGAQGGSAYKIALGGEMYYFYNFIEQRAPLPRRSRRKTPS